MTKTIQYQNLHIEEIFLNEIKRLSVACPELFERTENALILKNIVGPHGYHYKINYSLDSLAFNQAYFLKNLYKCSIALSYLKEAGLEGNCPTIDIGCGAGTFSLAHSIIFPKKQPMMSLLDRAPDQLNIAKKILSGSNVCYVSGNYSHCFFTDDQLSLFSYSLCEQECFKKDWPMKMVVIDYPDILDKFEKAIGQEYTIERYKIRISPGIVCSHLISEKEIEINLCYAIAKAKLVADYFDAWQCFDVVKLSNVFTADARYSILPINKVLIGLEQIKEYWQRNKQRQQDLRLFYKILSAENNICTVQFNAVFYDLEEKSKHLIDGVMYLHFNFNQIFLLEEFYNKYDL